MVKKIKNYIYDPQEVIGSGFSSKVFKGVNELTQETIAIKVLELSKIQSEVEKYLLNNEINALRALSHPHVLRTVEILMTKNNVYIMTEFCENGDLQQYVKKQGRLGDLEALHIIRDITDGYLAIEEKLIVHRDLKTANIFLTSTGARIADFGFCEFLNETKKPQLFYNVGSPAYMSPESYR
jgi:serine/threonine protein kinase